ncbi:MAG: NUDIX hydrolase [Eubacteriales bacterium]|nr:NUDIX hydrolase [Eubacteriales bacterium]
MKYTGIRKVAEGRFLSFYEVYYETGDGKRKAYEMVSRNRSMASLADVQNEGAVESVVMIMHDGEAHERILLNREFRMAVGGYSYNFPAGLVDAGESLEEAVARELREETGLTLVQIEERMGVSYAAVGISNERNRTFIGIARGELAESDSSFEETNAGWYTKEEVRELLKTEVFAARAQAYCYLWARSTEEGTGAET